MKRALFAVLAASLPAAALAAAGDTWYGIHHDDDVARVEIAPVERDARTVYIERDATPVYIERRGYVVREPREVIVYPAPADVYWYSYATTPPFDPLHPERGQLIGRGLFNKQGPNDFGS